jgi:hypothetical protein
MPRLTALGSAAALALAASALAACNVPPPDASEAPSAPTAPAAPGAPVSAAHKITAQGYGPLRVGMTRAEVEAALGPDSQPNAAGGPEPESCDMFRPAHAPDGLLVMVEDGRLTSVWVSDNPAVESDRALNVGDPAAEVKRVYGAAAEVSPHEYQDPPAEYVTAWSGPTRTGPNARGVKYEIGADGRVAAIAGGGPSIAYVEGCA